MKLITEHFDITDESCYLDLITDTHVLYYEFDNNHKIIDKMKFKLPTKEEWINILKKQEVIKPYRIKL